VEKAFIRKYFHKKCLTRPKDESWEGNDKKHGDCKASSFLILNHLGWLPGNRKHVLIGTNCAKGINVVLSDVVLSGWLVEHGFSHLVDISCWDDLGF